MPLLRLAAVDMLLAAHRAAAAGVVDAAVAVGVVDAEAVAADTGNL
jgi:hypothetical protein